MLVDDDVDDRYLIRSALDENEILINLIEFSGADEAIQYLNMSKSEVPELIVLDLNMPEVDGFEFLRRIRALERTKLTPCIVYSTSTDENDLIKSYELGANSFIVKPLSYEDIQAVFKSLCDYWLHTASLPIKLRNKTVSS